MAWYKTRATRFCSREIALNDEALVVYEEPDEYVWNEGEEKRDFAWEAFYEHPAFNQSYPLWSSWGLYERRIPISEEEAKQLLEERGTDEEYWKRIKERWYTKLQTILSMTNANRKTFAEKEKQLEKMKKTISALSYPESILFLEKSLLSTIQSEIRNLKNQKEKQERNQKDVQHILSQFYSFSGTEEEIQLIDRYWWMVEKGNYPVYVAEKTGIIETLRSRHSLVLAELEENGKKVSRWLKIQ